MIGVLVQLQWTMLKGRVVRSIRLLKQPKYFVGFLVGVGWMGLWVLRPMMRSKLSVVHGAVSPIGLQYLPLIHQFAALGVTLALPFPWLLPWGQLGLPFRESELTMLLQAPLSRRQVIQYGLLKSEIGVMLSGLILPLFVGLGSFGTRVLMGFGTWMLFEFWHLNGKWRALFNLRQTEVPVGLARARRWALTIGLVGFYAMLAGALKPWVIQIIKAFGGANFREVTAAFPAVTWPPLLKTLLTPAWWLTAPMFSGGGGAFVAAAIPVMLLILAQREVVLRSKARFEESALQRATKEEAKKAPGRRFTAISSRARLRRPFALDRPGPPEVALVWKNAMRVSRTRWLHVAYFGLAVWVAIAVLPGMLPFHAVLYSILALFGVVPMFLQPLLAGMTWHNDLRSDLPHIEMVRTWPVSAQRFVLAEVLSPAILSFGSAIMGGGVALASLFGSRLHESFSSEPSTLVLLPKTGLLGVGAGLAAILIFVGFLPMAASVSFFSSALQNIATLWVPAWMAHSTDRSRGLSALGQRLLVSTALSLALALSLIPGALLVGAAAGAQWLLGIPWSAWAFPLWGLLAAAPQVGIGWFVVQVAGRLWERLDPSQEILELGR
jgi:hypothetical protein